MLFRDKINCVIMKIQKCKGMNLKADCHSGRREIINFRKYFLEMDDKNLELIPLAEASKLTNYSQEYVSLLCRRGKMKGKKMGRNWFTTKEWIDDYINRTGGSGEIIIPVRIEDEMRGDEINEKKQTNKANAMPANSFSLTGKLIFATVILSVLTSGLVFLKQGFLYGTTEETGNFEQQILKPSDSIIYSEQYNEAILSSKTKSKPADANEIKPGKVAGASNENVNEESLLLDQQEQNFENLFNTVYHKIARFVAEVFISHQNKSTVPAEITGDL